MNSQLLGLLFVISIFAAFGASLRQRRRGGAALDQPLPLEPKCTLLTESEQRLYRRLVQALTHHLVLPQMQLWEALRFKHGRWNAGIVNRISQLLVDFPIVKPDTSIVAAVELDDASHDRRAPDRRKAHALNSARIPLLWRSVDEMPEIPAIASALGKVT